jgi:DNA-directed RNA polymerase specialized sigma subunit
MTTLTMKEEKRLEIIQRVFRGELTVMEAGMVIGVSERQCYRIKARVTSEERREWSMGIGAGRVSADLFEHHG